MTSINPKSGYLLDYPKLRKDIGDKYSEWIDVISNIEKVSREAQHQIKIDRDDLRSLLAAMLFGRTISNVGAATVVIETGYETQARVLLRVAMESLFTLVAIEINPDLADQFVKADLLESKRMFHKARGWKDPELKKQAEIHATDEKLEKILAAIDEAEIKKMTTEDYARAADLHDWYLTAYAIFSFSVHNNIRDLETHLNTSGDGEIIEIINEPTIEGLETLYLSGSEILIKALRSASSIFELNTDEFCTETTERINVLANQDEC